MKINHGKIVVMNWNVNLVTKIQLEESDTEEVEKFLGATVTSTGGAGENISARLGKAQAVFCNLKNIRRNSQLGINTKVFKFSVLAVLLFGCETWRMINHDENKLNVFTKARIRILKIYWPIKMSNEEIK